MRRNAISSIAVPLVVILFFSAAAADISADTTGSPASPSPIVRELGGIRIAASRDKDVVQMYGQGLFMRNEGILGGRYYTNKANSLTLHVITGADGIIVDIELLSGFHVPLDAPIDQAVPQVLPDHLIAEHNVRLGMSRAELVSILGVPRKFQESGGRHILEYHADRTHDSRVRQAYDAYYEFENHTLVGMRIHDGR